ncbi:MAG: beta-lactamase family protein [Anaerolineales bacterium]|nr:beta-lactamase family protein [Anaerolineales bacterium]
MQKQEKWSALREVVEREMTKHEVPGISWGIYQDGEVWVDGVGVTNIEHPLAVNADTLFQVGSITKTFVTLVVMQLVDEGLLALDAPVQRYLPEFKVVDGGVSAKVTLWHLLTHSSGFQGDFFYDTGSGADAMPLYMQAVEQLGQGAPLGEVFSYNNTGFYLCGAIIERVTGKAFEQVLQERIFNPLRMEHTYFDAGDVITHRFAVGHEKSSAGMIVARPWPLPRAAWPAGGIVTDVKDLLKYAQMQLRGGTSEDGTALLKPETFKQMHSPQFSIWKAEQQMGLAWFIDDHDGVEVHHHGGGTLGQVTLLSLVPERDFALVVFTNADPGGHVTRAVSKWILNAYLGIEIPTPKPQKAQAEDLKQFAGFYTRPFADFEVGLLNGCLVGQLVYRAGFPAQDSPAPPPPPPASLDLCAEDRLLVLDGPMKDAVIDVLRADDGAVKYLRIGLRVYKRK